MTERMLTDRLVRAQRMLNANLLVVPNCNTCVLGEADLFTVTRSNWGHEYEVKTNVKDFKADKKKDLKHRQLVEGVPTRLVRPWAAQDALIKTAFDEAMESPLVEEDPTFPGGATYFLDWRKPEKHIVRTFTYVVPESIVGQVTGLVPDHAGLLAIDLEARCHRVKVVKQPPVLKMSRKATEDECLKLARSVHFRFWAKRLREAS